MHTHTHTHTYIHTYIRYTYIHKYIHVLHTFKIRPNSTRSAHTPSPLALVSTLPLHIKLCFVTHFICFCLCLSFCPAEAIILVRQLLLMVVSCISFKRFDSILKFAIFFFFYCFKSTMDIGLDFVLNFNMISSNVVHVHVYCNLLYLCFLPCQSFVLISHYCLLQIVIFLKHQMQS